MEALISNKKRLDMELNKIRNLMANSCSNRSMKFTDFVIWENGPYIHRRSIKESHKNFYNQVVGRGYSTLENAVTELKMRRELFSGTIN